MKYDTRIVQQPQGYVGYCLLYGEVVFTSKDCNTAQQASSEIAQYTKANKHIEPTLKTNRTPATYPSQAIGTQLQSSYVAPARKCCGRG